jgi:hypothetical protein
VTKEIKEKLEYKVIGLTEIKVKEPRSNRRNWKLPDHKVKQEPTVNGETKHWR